MWIMPRCDERGADSDLDMNMYGTTLRSWDAATQSWRIAWTHPVRGHHEEQVGRWNGQDILQEGTRPDGTRTRWTFTEITADAFHWRGEALKPKQSTLRPGANIGKRALPVNTGAGPEVDEHDFAEELFPAQAR